MQDKTPFPLDATEIRLLRVLVYVFFTYLIAGIVHNYTITHSYTITYIYSEAGMGYDIISQICVRVTRKEHSDIYRWCSSRSVYASADLIDISADSVALGSDSVCVQSDLELYSS